MSESRAVVGSDFQFTDKVNEERDAAHTKPKSIRNICALAITLNKTGNLACHNN